MSATPPVPFAVSRLDVVDFKMLPAPASSTLILVSPTRRSSSLGPTMFFGPGVVALLTTPSLLATDKLLATTITLAFGVGERKK